MGTNYAADLFLFWGPYQIVFKLGIRIFQHMIHLESFFNAKKTLQGYFSKQWRPRCGNSSGGLHSLLKKDFQRKEYNDFW